MGTLLHYISQRIVLSPSIRERDEYFFRTPEPKLNNQPYNSRNIRVAESDRERALLQFPCEEKHSFNPHYQHNLSTSPSLSTVPSLSSSPTNSSPSSAYSSSSSLSRATGTKAFAHDSYMHQHNYGTVNSSQNNKSDYSYRRRHDRQQAMRSYTYQQQQHESYVDDWMFGIAEDDGIYRGSTAMMNETLSASTCNRVHPQESPLSPSNSSVSLKSSLSRKGRSQRSNVNDNTFSNPSRSTVSFSPVVLENDSSRQDRTVITSVSSSTSGLLPSISESVSMDNAIATITPTAMRLTFPQQALEQELSSDTGRLTAKQSLMRISQCSKSKDGWCSQKAGQYTARYAQSSRRSMAFDGRRGRDM